ncbi:MAG TPA: DUF3800 domain-containing protein [Gammaproteobacteria bacterium]|nr:DUF3800 domain-containing protein [Gammaproteobacteria bacterium]
MLKAYFDDSGIHGGSKAALWAGFMGVAEEWAQMEKEWAALLSRENLRSFHMWDLSHFDGQCQSIEWTQGKRDWVIREFREILSHRNIIGIVAVIRVDDWNEVVKPGSYLEQKLVSPIYLAFELAMQSALNRAKIAADMTGIVEKVSFFFDLREKQASINWDIAKQYGEHERWKPWFQGISFASVEDTLPLQAADMLAYETYLLERERNKIGNHATLRAHLEALLRSVPVEGTYYDAQALRVLCRAILEYERPDLLAEFDASQENRQN